MNHKLIFVVLPLILFPISALSAAESSLAEVSELKSQIASLTKLVETLSARVEQLDTAKQFEAEMAKSAPVATPPRAQISSGGGVNQNQNPDISVVGMAIGKVTGDKLDPDRNSFGLDESEVVFTKNVSPYTRANLTLGFRDDEAEVEEGYADFSHLLPAKVEARVGKFLTPVGYLNTVHSHDWPMVARPLPQEFFLGNEGMSEKGVSFSKLIDLKSKTYVKADADFLKGENPILFNNDQKRVFGGRIVSNTPLNDRDDLNLGVDFHEGSWNTEGDLYSKLTGFNMMLRRRFNQFNRFVLWGECFRNEREQLNRSSITSMGYYLTALYKFKRDRDWHVGLEYDCSEKPGDNQYNAVAKSIFVGYWLTENDRLQLQFRNLRDPFSERANNEVLLEVIWGMGPHKAHLANF